jgi:hypothetical protein
MRFIIFVRQALLSAIKDTKIHDGFPVLRNGAVTEKAIQRQMKGQFMNDREKDEEIVVTYFTKQYRNVPRMTTVKHKKTENNWSPGSPGVTMFIKTVPTVLGSHNICKETSVF